MRSLVLSILIAVAGLMILPQVYAASAGTTLTAATQAAPRGISTSRVETLSKDAEQIALLRAELKATKDFNSAILSTVYWALGGTFVLVGLLLGFGWFANFRVYERDKAAMKAELDAAIAAKAAEIEVQVAEKMSKLTEQAAAAASEASSRKLKDMQQSIDSLSAKIFNSEVRRLKREMHANPSDNMALTDALSLIRLCVKKRPDELPDIMHFMLKKIDKGGKLTANEITDLNEILDSLPPHYRTLTEKLRAKLVASDIF